MLSDEEKKAIEYFKRRIENKKTIYTSIYFKIEKLELLLNLIEKQSKEIEELKEQCKEVVCVPEGTCFMLEPKDVDKKWEDKIKAKIEPRLKELDEQMKKEWKEYGNSREYQDMEDEWNFLQSLLEKE